MPRVTVVLLVSTMHLMVTLQYRPTAEETEIIMELQMALHEVLKDTDNFDVYDALDEEDLEEGTEDTATDSNAAASSAESGG